MSDISIYIMIYSRIIVLKTKYFKINNNITYFVMYLFCNV